MESDYCSELWCHDLLSASKSRRFLDYLFVLGIFCVRSLSESSKVSFNLATNYSETPPLKPYGSVCHAEKWQNYTKAGNTWEQHGTRPRRDNQLRDIEQGKWAVVKLGETCETKSFSWKDNLEKASEMTRNHQALHQTCGTWQASLEVAWSCSNTLSWNTRRMK